MLRTHTCGELNISNLGETVTLCGWVQKSRDLGAMTFIDVRDRYGLTQLVLNTDSDAALRETSRGLGREFVIKVTGKVLERTSKNAKMATGEIFTSFPIAIVPVRSLITIFASRSVSTVKDSISETNSTGRVA